MRDYYFIYNINKKYNINNNNKIDNRMETIYISSTRIMKSYLSIHEVV